jgi:hypothetical protein
MDMRRAADKAPQISRKTAGRRDAAIFARSLVESDATMRDVMVAGGLLSFTPAQMFPREAA